MSDNPRLHMISGEVIAFPARQKLMAAVVSVALTGFPTYTQVLPVNTRRWAIVLPPNSSGSQYVVRPVGYGYKQTTDGFWVNAGSIPTVLTREIIGDLVTQAWEGSNGGNAAGIAIIETLDC